MKLPEIFLLDRVPAVLLIWFRIRNLQTQKKVIPPQTYGENKIKTRVGQ
jgi:hypothetical protein